MTRLCREKLRPLLENNFAALEGKSPHPGLLLARGMADYPEGAGAGEAKAAFIRALSQLEASPFYEAAFERWERITRNDTRFATLEAPLQGRLTIGVVRDNPLETGLTTAHAYGMPLIPGSAVKGLCRAAAGEWEMPEATREWIFGREPEYAIDPGEAGGLVFHDAWWIPEGRPYAPEIVTPHHPGYYGSEGETAATDFDSPIPAPQIAARGGFYFAIEGAPEWAAVAVKLLKAALNERGIGGKRSAGYGYFADGDGR
ncbi:MAG: type III-B CRISPR module RAMP protein Cmr6 [Pseudomonadota bacterium]|nr:type III-B CRISPR module RAMP protein Cmr6 [Pseudomonadota bacterium]